MRFILLLSCFFHNFRFARAKSLFTSFSIGSRLLRCLETFVCVGLPSPSDFLDLLTEFSLEVTPQEELQSSQCHPMDWAMDLLFKSSLVCLFGSDYLGASPEALGAIVVVVAISGGYKLVRRWGWL